MVYEIIPQSHRAHGGRTDGDDYCSEANMLFISSVGNKVIARLCELCASVVNNRGSIILTKGDNNSYIEIESLKPRLSSHPLLSQPQFRR